MRSNKELIWICVYLCKTMEYESNELGSEIRVNSSLSAYRLHTALEINQTK